MEAAKGKEYKLCHDIDTHKCCMGGGDTSLYDLIVQQAIIATCSVGMNAP